MIRKLEVIQYIWNLRLHDMRKLEVVHKEVGGCTFGIWGYMKKLEVVHKVVSGCAMPYNHQLACLRKLWVISLTKCTRIVASIVLNDKWWLTVPYTCILYNEVELPGQLKSIHFCGNFRILYAPCWCYLNALSTSSGYPMMNAQKYTNFPIIIQYISHKHNTHAYTPQQLTLIWHM